MDPRPRNFVDPIFVSKLADRSHLVRIVRDGIVDTSMPAWRDVLDEQQINAVVSYLQAAFIDTTTMKD